MVDLLDLAAGLILLAFAVYLTVDPARTALGAAGSQPSPPRPPETPPADC